VAGRGPPHELCGALPESEALFRSGEDGGMYEGNGLETGSVELFRYAKGAEGRAKTSKDGWTSSRM